MCRALFEAHYIHLLLRTILRHRYFGIFTLQVRKLWHRVKEPKLAQLESAGTDL